MSDPTYDKTVINANPIWKVAFVLSECLNDNAPIGWGKYVWVAEQLARSASPSGDSGVREALTDAECDAILDARKETHRRRIGRAWERSLLREGARAAIEREEGEKKA